MAEDLSAHNGSNAFLRRSRFDANLRSFIVFFSKKVNDFQFESNGQTDLNEL